MFSTISWQQYIITLLIDTLLYYLFVWIIFFKAKLSFFTVITNFKDFPLHGGDEPDELMTTIQYILDDIRPVFAGRTNKAELLLVLQIKLKEYYQWEEPGFRDTINQSILSESQSKCSIHLGEEDLRLMWK